MQGPSAEPAHPEPELAARLTVALGRLGRAIRRVGDHGLGPAALSVLFSVARSGPLRLGELASREGLSAPTLSRVVGGLHRAGLVGRSSDPDDRWATPVSITPAGRRMADEIRQSWVRQLLTWADDLPVAELARLLDAVPVLERLAARDA